MKRILALRPSPAMAVASIALFVSLGGVSYGVATGFVDSREIADNTIRSKDVRNNNLRSRDIRNNEVRGIDIRNGTIRRRDVASNTLTGDQILERKLEQVPSAALAASATRAGDAARLGGLLPSAFASSDVERVMPATLAPGVTPAPLDLAPGFWKDPFGTVHLQGTATGVATAVLELPIGYRPAGRARFAAPDGVTVVVEADGHVDALGGATVSLDGIAFRAD
ncbi:MAG: hypothetical protein WD993_07015 [Thermoleophilaceae bacterium]